MTNKITTAELARRRPALIVPLKTPVSEALQLMAQHKVTALCIERRGKIAGIFTVKDVMTRVLGYKTAAIWRKPKKRKIRDVPLRVLMSSDLVTIDGGADAQSALDLMQRHKIRHLPVLHDGQVLGVITLRDVMTALGRVPAGSGRSQKYPRAARMYFEDSYAGARLAPQPVRH